MKAMNDPKPGERDILYIIGLTLIIISTTICVYFWAIVFFGPVWIVGVGLVWFSSKSIKQKLLTTIIPILLWIPAVYALIEYSKNI